MGKIQKEIEGLIKLGKQTGDMKLRNSAQAALFGLMADDGTPGLGLYLWENEVLPNLEKAQKRADYIHQTQCVVNTAKILSTRHYSSKCRK